MTKKRSMPLDEFEIFQRGYTEGIMEGRRQMVTEVLTYLQDRYMDRTNVRGSTLGMAILEVAADVSAHVKELKAKETKVPQDHQQKHTSSFIKD